MNTCFQYFSKTRFLQSKFIRSRVFSKFYSFYSLCLGCLIAFATPAFAESAQKATASTSSQPATVAGAAPESMTSSALSQGLMLGAFALIFYFLVLRPQSKRAKEHRALVTGLQKGDEVLTSGGIVGKVAKITDDFISLNISDNIEILIQRQAIAGLLPKGTMKSI